MSEHDEPSTTITRTRAQLETLDQHPELAANKSLIDMARQLLVDYPERATFEITIKGPFDRLAKGSA